MDDSPRLPQQIPADLLGNSTTVLRSRKKSSSVGTLLSVVGGGVAAIPISIVLMWYVLGKDPLEMGPLVSNFVPWIVPERFRGSMASGIEELPEMPPMVGPAFSSSDPNEPRNFPTIGGLPVDEPLSKPELSESTVGPSLETETSLATTTPMVASTPATLVTSTPETLALETSPIATLPEPTLPTPMLPTPSLPTTALPTTALPTALESNVEAPSSDSKIEQSFTELSKAIQVFDRGAFESGAILYRALEAFGEQLAAIPESSPEHTQWRSKGSEACQAIVTNSDMLKSFNVFISRGSTELFPGEQNGYREQSVKVDFVVVQSVENQSDYDVWTISKRYQTSLESRPLVVPHSLGITAQPANIFLILGVSEVQPESRKLVLRTILAVPRK